MSFLPINFKKIGLIIIMSSFFFTIFGLKEARAINLDKYNFYGSVEIDLKKEDEKTGTSKSSYTSFEHMYKLNVNSFVLSPLLLNYDLGVSVTRGSAKSNGVSGDLNSLGYNVKVNLFSARPFATSLYANRETINTFTPLTTSTGSVLVTQTAENYGALINLKYNIFPTTINMEQNSLKGTSSLLKIDRKTRRVLVNSNKDFYGFSGRYGYQYADTIDKVDKTNSAATHEVTANLERKISDSMNFREDIRFYSTDNFGGYNDLTSNSYFSYRPSQDFTNETNLNFYYFNQRDIPGLNMLANNLTNYKINSELLFTGNINAGYFDSGSGNKNSSESINTSLNYNKIISGWNCQTTGILGLNANQETKGISKNSENIGLNSLVSKNFEWLKSAVTLGTASGKTVSSLGGDLTFWNANTGWTAFPTQKVRFQSNLRYNIESTKNDEVTITDISGITTTQQMGKYTTKGISLDSNYTWNAYTSEIGTAEVTGGFLISQTNNSSGNASTNYDRKFFYNQVLFRMVPYRNLLMSFTLRGEWDSATIASFASTGSNTSPRKTYIISSEIDYRIRKILIQLKQNYRKETNFGLPYNRSSVYLQVLRPF